ncbi:MAG: hypothetical protein RR140_00610 [Clostridia bacterium]
MNDYTHFFNTENYLRFKQQFEFLPHAILILSPDQQSNIAIAKCAVNRLFCNTTCGTCKNCIMMNHGTHPDLHILPKIKNFVVSDSEYVIENSILSPMEANEKVFLLNNMQNSTQQAQNKLLKILEEPPVNVHFILTATSLDNILPSVLSRIQIFNLFEFSQTDIQKIFENSNEIVTSAFVWPGMADELLTNPKLRESYNFAQNAFFELKSSKDVPKFSQQMIALENIPISLKFLMELLHSTLLCLCNKENLVADDVKDKLKSVQQDYTVESVVEIMKKVNIAILQLLSNVTPGIVADNLMIGILESKFKHKK